MELNFEESVYNNVLEGCQGNLVGQFEAAVRRSRRISLTLVRFAIAPREASPHEFSDSTTAHAFTNVRR